MVNTRLQRIRKINAKLQFVLCFLGFVFPNSFLYGQTWSPISGGGADDWVYSTVLYNGELIIGGKFTSVDGVSANHIACWNGSTWSPLGAGVNGKVNALTVYKGNLIAAGEFTTAGDLPVNFIALWNGSSWSDELGGVGNIVTSLAVIGDTLFAGGYFTEADNTPVNYIARRDTGWVDLAGGMSGYEGQVMALKVFNNELYAGGFFSNAGGVPVNHIAKWNGSSWSALGDGVSGIVYTLGEYQNNLIAGGLFLNAGGHPVNHIASWDGSNWTAFGNGMSGTFYQYVFALAVYNNELIAGGYFTESDGLTTNGIARWNGSSWNAMGNGLLYPGNVFGAHTLINYGSDLIVGGLFSSAGGVGAAHIAKWNAPISDINQHNTNKIFVYPNPATDYIQVNAVNHLSLYSIIDQFGRIVLCGKTTIENPVIDISKLNNGIYFFMSGQSICKFLKNK
jgi:hypothetical protein